MRNSVLPVTKVGPGEKERAYVVRQNLCLKIFLGVVFLLIACCTSCCAMAQRACYTNLCHGTRLEAHIPPAVQVSNKCHG